MIRNIVFIFALFAAQTSFADSNCDSIMAKGTEDRVPFYPIEKPSKEDVEYSELSSDEIEFLLNNLYKSNIASYQAEDSGDAGFHLSLVDQTTCAIIWSGFLVNY